MVRSGKKTMATISRLTFHRSSLKSSLLNQGLLRRKQLQLQSLVVTNRRLVYDRKKKKKWRRQHARQLCQDRKTSPHLKKKKKQRTDLKAAFPLSRLALARD